MIRNIARRFLFAALVAAGCGGCGGNNTNGSLALTVTPTDLTGGNYNVVALAIYTPPLLTGGTVGTGVSIPTNTPITLVENIHNLSGTFSKVETQKLNADSTGTVNGNFNIVQTTETLYVDITASTGGLSVTKSVSIPALSSLTTTPTVVSFPSTAQAGAQQSLTVSGGTQPYRASIDASHAGDFTVNVNGATVTLVKTNNSGLTAIQAQLTITDNNGNSVTIPVGYN